jgi:hypothetical protein
LTLDAERQVQGKMDFEDFFAEVETTQRSLVVVNRTVPRQFQDILSKTFDEQPVPLEERDVPEMDDNVVALVEESDEGREVLATSPLDALSETILLVNSDLYKSGAVGLDEFELPEVLERLDDVPFRLQGYPESNTEKLLLIVISRYIERRAWQMGRGTLRSSFQRLSRINDERGTRTVYETIADSDVDTHLYGVPDWQPPVEFDVTTHGGYSDPFQKSWFVVYTPPEGGLPESDLEDPHVGLLALEVAPREWKGFWTFRPELVEDLDGHIARNL